MISPDKPENQISTTVLKPRNCAHWVDQLQKLFPQTSVPVTVEFARAMGEIMALYPEHIIAAVCSPIYGICTRYKYLPSLMELKEELEKIAQRDAEREAILKRRERQFEERSEREEEVARTRADGTRPTYEQLVAKLPPSLRPGAVYDKPAFDPVKAMEKLGKVGITKEIFDAIPNQKDYDWKKPALNIQKEPNPFDP